MERDDDDDAISSVVLLLLQFAIIIAICNRCAYKFITATTRLIAISNIAGLGRFIDMKSKRILLHEHT